MNLVQFLVAGVRGAESGSAVFLLRGTATPATLYSDFEGQAALGSHIVTLNSFGAAEVYCDAYCDVSLNTSGGTLIRTVTIGETATTTEYIGPSFTGTSYLDASTGVNKPVTVDTIFDRWITSAGSPDWKVLVGGVATNLSSAMASISGIFVNVKDEAYGAVGDGAADDTTAVNLAIADAEDKILFFPAGEYRITAEIDLATNITLMGCGMDSSFIVMDSATGGNVFDIAGATKTVRFCQLGIIFAQVCTKTVINQSGTRGALSIDSCRLGDSIGTGPLLSTANTCNDTEVILSNSYLFVDAASSLAVRNLADDQESRIFVNSCFIFIELGFDNSVFEGPDFCVYGCHIETLSTSAHYIFDCESNGTAGAYVGSITGCRFVKAAGSCIAFKLTSADDNSNFIEASNRFNGPFYPASATETGTIYDYSAATLNNEIKIILNSRIGTAVVFVSTFTGTVTADAHICYETVILTATSSTAVTLVPFTTSNIPFGAKCTYAINNISAGTKDITFAGAGTGDSIAFSAVAINGTAVAQYILISNAGGDNPVIIGSGKND